MNLRFCLAIAFVFTFWDIKAQPFVNGDTGFSVNYATSCLSQFNNTGLYFSGGNLTGSGVIDGTGLARFNSVSSISAGASPCYLDFYCVSGANCQPLRLMNAGIDLSGINSKVVIYAKANVATSIEFYIAHSDGSYPTSQSFLDITPKTITVGTQMAAYEIDFSDWNNLTGRSSVNMYGFILRDPNITLDIEKIEFGTAVTPNYYNKIKGTIYSDVSVNCTLDLTDEKVEGVLLKAIGDNGKTFYGISQTDGSYSIAVDSGTINYTVSQEFNAKNAQFLINNCVANYVVNATGSASDFCCFDFFNTVRFCSLLTVEISSDRRRRCFRNNTTVNYNNDGIETASNVVVKVVYPTYVVPISSIPAWDAKVGDTLFYNVGSVAFRANQKIQLVDSVICGMEEIRGLTQCTKAYISKVSTCLLEDPLWDHSSVQVQGSCESNSAQFVIRNAGTGNMTQPSDYRIYLNDTLILSSTFQLNTGATLTLAYPSNGGTVRLEADQVPLHPGKSRPRAFVEGCGGLLIDASRGFASSVPQDDLDEEAAVSCLPILDSYDPNDKKVLPEGGGPDKLVPAGQQLYYTIRFQNTGSDLAYNIKVIDTLDTDLDIQSFVKGASSHDYVLEVSGSDTTILNFHFNNINLPDSTSNEAGSHGFISFYINTIDNLADDTEIKNTAGIYFDYNSPVITNTTTQMIGTYIPTDLSKGDLVKVVTSIQNETLNEKNSNVYPNPTSETVFVQVSDMKEGDIIFYDLSGQEHLRAELNTKITQVSVSSLSSGLYIYKIQSNGEWVGVGKLLVK